MNQTDERPIFSHLKGVESNDAMPKKKREPENGSLGMLGVD
jgi:hypothetical protein